MHSTPFILASGIPIQAIVGGIVVVFWVLTAIFGKKTPAPPQGTTPRRPPDAQQLRAVQARMMNAAQPQRPIAAGPPPLPAASQKKGKRGKSRAAAPAPAPAQAAPVRPPASDQSAVPTVVMLDRAIPGTETVHNVRAMIKRGSMREAFVLAEIMGKPKAME